MKNNIEKAMTSFSRMKVEIKKERDKLKSEKRAFSKATDKFQAKVKGQIVELNVGGTTEGF